MKCVPQHVYFIMDKRNILAFYVFIIAHYKGNVNHIDVNFVKKM
nr:MAG TPA: hypothetical protein [Caudoviricetes sp.]